jgi:pyruvate dehydrogenase E1 component alpha subunit
MGSTAIVGGTVPVGVGLALAKSMAGGDDLVCIFIGDAVLETGVFFEAANFAVLRRLPVLFLCENNLYSVYSPLSVRQPAGRSLTSVAAGVGLAAASGDGNDVAAAHALIDAAAQRIRKGGGPQFVELATYRWREHCGPLFDNDIGYRTEQEFEDWKARDPIVLFRDKLLAAKTIDVAWLKTTTATLDNEVAEAFAFAEASPFPEPAERFTGLYGRQAADGTAL